MIGAIRKRDILAHPFVTIHSFGWQVFFRALAAGRNAHRHCAATAGTDDDIRLVLVEFGLGEPDGGIEIVVGQVWIEDFVAVVFQVGRLKTARCRLPAVEEEDLHGGIVVDFGFGGNSHWTFTAHLGKRPTETSDRLAVQHWCTDAWHSMTFLFIPLGVNTKSNALLPLVEQPWCPFDNRLMSVPPQDGHFRQVISTR